MKRAARGMRTVAIAGLVWAVGQTAPAFACFIMPATPAQQYAIDLSLQRDFREEAVSVFLARVVDVREHDRGDMVHFQPVVGLEGEEPPRRLAMLDWGPGDCPSRFPEWRTGDVAIVYAVREEAWSAATGESLGPILRTEVALRPQEIVDPDIAPLIRAAARRLRPGDE